MEQENIVIKFLSENNILIGTLIFPHEIDDKKSFDRLIQSIALSREIQTSINGKELGENQYLIQKVSDFLSIPMDSIVLSTLDITSTALNNYRRLLLKVIVLPLDKIDKVCQTFAINQMEPVNLKCSANTSIKFNYTVQTTIMDLKQEMEKQYKIPAAMQHIYRHGKKIVDMERKIIDHINPGEVRERGCDFLCAVRISLMKNTSSTIDEIYQTCSENDITILETITLLFATGVTLEVIHLREHPNLRDLNDVVKHIYEKEIYKGKFQLYNQHGCYLYHRSLEDLFLEIQSETQQHFHSNLNLVFVPDLRTRFKDTAFLDQHRTNLCKTVRLRFITKEEVVHVSGSLSVNSLKKIIERKFRIPPYQQTLFHDKQQLKDGTFLTNLYIDEHQRGHADTSEELKINVVVSKARTVDVHVTCTFLSLVREQSSSLSEFVLNVEDNLTAKDLLKIIQNRIQYQHPLAMELNRTNLLGDNNDNNKMLYEFLPRANNNKATTNDGNVLKAVVSKFVNVTFHDETPQTIKAAKVDTEQYVITRYNRFVIEIIGFFEDKKKKEYEIAFGTNIEWATSLMSLDSGATIHLVQIDNTTKEKRKSHSVVPRFFRFLTVSPFQYKKQ